MAVVRATPPLSARLLAEGLGTGFLVAAVVGSGVAAVRLSPDDVGLQLLENSTATALVLAALILCFGPVSGAHLNPAVTLAERLSGTIDTRTGAFYMIAQIIGGSAGTIVANLMFELPAVELAGNDRITAAAFLAEVVATFGLVTIIFGVVRSGHLQAVPVAVAGYIGAAYWFTSSTSFANPAVTVARTLSDSFAGIAPASAPAFVAAQVTGALLAVGCGRVLFTHLDPGGAAAASAGTDAVHTRLGSDGDGGDSAPASARSVAATDDGDGRSAENRATSHRNQDKPEPPAVRRDSGDGDDAYGRATTTTSPIGRSTEDK